MARASSPVWMDRSLMRTRWTSRCWCSATRCIAMLSSVRWRNFNEPMEWKNPTRNWNVPAQRPEQADKETGDESHDDKNVEKSAAHEGTHQSSASTDAGTTGGGEGSQLH